LAAGLVWFGLVWFGLVWFGLVWFGLVWFGLVCSISGFQLRLYMSPWPTVPGLEMGIIQALAYACFPLCALKQLVCQAVPWPP
jgi:hypothetical protein